MNVLSQQAETKRLWIGEEDDDDEPENSDNNEPTPLKDLPKDEKAEITRKRTHAICELAGRFIVAKQTMKRLPQEWVEICIEETAEKYGIHKGYIKPTAIKQRIYSQSAHVRVLRQSEFKLQQLSYKNSNYVKEVANHATELINRKKSNGHIPDEFWKLYDKSEDYALEQFNIRPNVIFLAKPMTELFQFKKISNKFNWNCTAEIHTRMADLVRTYFQILIEKSRLWDIRKWQYKVQPKESLLLFVWDSLTPQEWCIIFESVLQLSNERYFCEYYGCERSLLKQFKLAFEMCVREEEAVAEKSSSSSSCQTTKPLATFWCVNCNQSCISIACSDCGRLTDKKMNNDSTKKKRKNNHNETKSSSSDRIKKPLSINDPSHGGYILQVYFDTLKEYHEK